MKNQTSGWMLVKRGVRLLPAVALLVVCAQAPGHAGTDRRFPNAGCESSLALCGESNLASAIPALPQAEKRTIYTQDSFQWNAKLAAGQTLEVIGRNGEIEASGASGDSTEVSATKRGGDEKDAFIEVVEYSDGVTICAVYAREAKPGRCHRGGVDSESMSSFWHNSHTKITFYAKVPRGVNLKAETTNGDVRARDLNSVVEAFTTNGSVNVSTTEWASGHTTNGQIEIRMGKANWTGELSLATTNGGINVSLPASADFKVRAATTNGGISSDFPITVSGSFGGKTINGTVGAGSRDLHLATTNGGIEIRKSGS